MEARAREKHADGHKTDLFKLMEHHGRTRLTSGIWARALEHGDKLATELIDEAVEALGAGDRVGRQPARLRGGRDRRRARRALRRAVSSSASREAMHRTCSSTSARRRCELAALGDLGGAIGAALLAR